MLENRSSPWVHGWPRWHSTRSATCQDPAGATVLGPVGSVLGPDRAASDLPSVTTQAGDITEEVPRGASELTPCSGDGSLRTSFSPQKVAQEQGTQVMEPHTQTCSTQRHTAHTHRPSRSTPTHAYTCTHLTGTRAHAYTCRRFTCSRALAHMLTRAHGSCTHRHSHTCLHVHTAHMLTGIAHMHTCAGGSCSRALAHMHTHAGSSCSRALTCTRLTHRHSRTRPHVHTAHTHSRRP